MSDYKTVFAAAVQLTVEERLLLIDELAATIPEEQPDLSPEWQAEVERRWEEIRAGAVKTVPWEEVKKSLDKIIRG